MIRRRFTLRQLMIAVAIAGAIVAVERWLLTSLMMMARRGDTIGWREVFVAWLCVHAVVLVPNGVVAYSVFLRSRCPVTPDPPEPE